jgi:thioredoxin 1
MIEIRDDNVEQLVRQYSKPLIVDFCASWCSHCNEMASTFDSLAETYASKIIFGKCDVNKNQLAANRFGIRSIPRLVILRNGQVIHAMTGLASRDSIEEAIQRVLSENGASALKFSSDQQPPSSKEAHP